MALELWETLKEAIPVYTGLTPSTFFTVIALGFALYYLATTLFGGPSPHEQHLHARAFEPEMEPLRPPVQLGEVTAEDLMAYDGTDPKKPLLMAIKGQIYDVTQSRMFYGPGGPYALFAGKDASRALAKMSFEEADLTGDITGLGAFELDALQDWEFKFMSKYTKVGTIVKNIPIADGSSAIDSPREPKTEEVAADTTAAKTEDIPVADSNGKND